jgi:hypothetical protein
LVRGERERGKEQANFTVDWQNNEREGKEKAVRENQPVGPAKEGR